MPSSSNRPALLAIAHLLCYSAPSTNPAFVVPKTFEEKVFHQQITNLLNEYSYLLDTCMVEHMAAAKKWAKLSTSDCELTYPFGTHRGIPGLVEWCLQAETRFTRMTHMSSNFVIKFESDTVARARSTLHAACGLHETDLGQTFHEGGYYYWSFRKMWGKWKISYLFLDVTWTLGDSLGLNEPGPTDIKQTIDTSCYAQAKTRDEDSRSGTRCGRQSSDFILLGFVLGDCIRSPYIYAKSPPTIFSIPPAQTKQIPSPRIILLLL